MELYSKIRQFVDLQRNVKTETSKIFEPIRDEVERKDKKDLLFPPVTNTLSIKWLVEVPESYLSTYYYYLVLMIHPDQETDEVNLVLTSLEEQMPYEVFLEKFHKTFNAMCKNAIEITQENIERYITYLPEEMPENLEEDENDEYYDWDPGELGRFPLNGINPTVVAKKIITEAKRIFKMEKLRLANTPKAGSR
jgi:hypothetical protein